ncbi:hypothetical protein NHX12_022208 [Muraenolepis orangiensis]|uniref:BEACH domain-containing protein n=1 Tax=Muraenolepis orangiensis TaxID=630683 RepID=A0A9Q0EMS4_9TELE|nr:hypothetical protein NHX12_022208 [Muraenolepis orangiensis]
MSNFEYLMHLNTLSGRTYNDMMQYPVFPWVLADYLSETLDLSNPATFRDLSKPMGAQTERRRDMFVERYEDMENSDASFLVRMEPFSHTFQTLQGGFDIPERMFHSVAREWASASRDNMGDVRELIPEFYYLPDFLSNSNHIQLGCMEDGTTLGDVVLPPWAKDDPQEFIRAHREALESDYVSSHLHLWIDLIFGHRQQGPAAVESLNTFHPYFYAQRRTRGQEALLDPLIKSTMLGYVSNFGQVPKQLFTKPHPARWASKKETSSPAHPPPFFFSPEKLKTSAQPFREVAGGPVGQMVCLEREVVVLGRRRLLVCPLWSCSVSWGFPDSSCAFGNYATEKTFAVCEGLKDWGETLCAACPNPSLLITAGSSTVPLYGHVDAVTCLAVSEGHGVIVSGSRDRTCILWDLAELSYVTQLAGHDAGVSALAINELTGEMASCAGAVLHLWTMKGQLLSLLDTTSGPLGDILCVVFTQSHEWDARNAIEPCYSVSRRHLGEGLHLVMLMRCTSPAPSTSQDRMKRVRCTSPAPSTSWDRMKRVRSTSPAPSTSQDRMKRVTHLGAPGSLGSSRGLWGAPGVSGELPGLWGAPGVSGELQGSLVSSRVSGELQGSLVSSRGLWGAPGVSGELQGSLGSRLPSLYTRALYSSPDSILKNTLSSHGFIP